MGFVDGVDASSSTWRLTGRGGDLGKRDSSGGVWLAQIPPKPDRIAIGEPQ
jgi:hypothetical protein